MSEEIVNSEDMQFYEYLGLLEQAYYDTHVGSKAGTIIIETIKSYVNILKYKNNKLQQKVEEKDKENKELNRMCELYGQSLYNADLTKAEKRVEQLENIRKEAIEYLESEENIIDRFWKHDFRKYPDYNPFEAKDEEEVRCVELYGYDDLLNILNKGSEK